MAVNTTKPRSRRELLFGALGGVVALAAQALGRPVPVRAEGEAIVVGGEYDTATSLTQIWNKTNNENVFSALSNGVGTGVFGFSDSGTGVIGRSFGTGSGVEGSSGNGYGGLFDGARAQLRLVPKSTAGRPTAGDHNKGEIHLDSKGSLFVCVAAGVPGTWKKLTAKLV